jgi:hypothetical protein
MENTQGLRREKAILPEARVILTHIRVGTSPEVSQSQKDYNGAREMLLNPNVKFSPDLIATTLNARLEELDEAIANSPLKSAADRGGYTLGSLKELTSLAQQELKGDLQAKTALKKQLEMITDEEEIKVRDETRNMTYEGVSIDRKSGSIVIQSFPSQNARDMEANMANYKKENFLKGKERLQKFASELK